MNSSVISKNKMKALILSAGYATRLYPLTKEYPKPLLPIAKLPIINYNISKLDKIKEINEILVITNNKFFDNFLTWVKSAQSDTRIPIKVINDGTKTESDRLGAIGDIRFALEKEDIREDVVIIGGDNLFEDDLSDFMSFSCTKRPSVTIGVYDIKEISRAAKYGVVKLDSGMKILDFTEKPKLPESALVATCLYYIPQEKLKYFKEYFDSKSESDAAGSFISWLSRKEDVYSFVFRKHWYDIGDFSAYQEADKVFTELKERPGI